jgi:hypothetical protein
MIVCAAILSLLVPFALTLGLTPTALFGAVSTTTPARSIATNDNTDCETFQRWFARQPGSQLVQSSTNDFYEKSARPRKPDTVLDYAAFPLSHDQASWYKTMKHYRNNFGNGRCLSGSYDSAHKTALIYSQYGTASDLTVTTVSSVPTGLPIHSAPNLTKNGAYLGMSVAQVKAIDGPGTVRSDGRYQRLSYNQNFTTSANVQVIAYLGFLFVDGRLVAIDVGGGV